MIRSRWEPTPIADSEEPLMDLRVSRKDSLMNTRSRIPATTLSSHFVRFLKDELPGSFPDDCCTNSTPENDFPWPKKESMDRIVSESEDEFPTMISLGVPTMKKCPATRALELSRHLDQKRRAGITAASDPTPKRMIPRKNLKRSRSSLGRFDMGDLVEAALPVEQSIAFPSIEWHSYDDNDADDESEEASSSSKDEISPLEDDYFDPVRPPPAKRFCRGLVRSQEVAYDLSQLESLG